MAIIIPIGIDTSGLKKLRGAENKLQKFGKIAAVAAGAAALGGLVKTLEIGVKGLMDQQKATAQTQAVLKSTGNTANTTAAAIEQLAGALEMKTGIDAEQVQAGANLLATFSAVRNEVGRGNDIFDQATRTALDMSVTFGTTTSAAAIQLGKALQDPIRGVTALRRTGISFTESQLETIKSMVESNRILDAQKLILGEVNKQVEGSAAAYGTTLEGQLQRARKAFDQVAEQLAIKLIPAFARGTEIVTEFLSEFADAPTLRAKVQVTTEPIEAAFNRIKTWWTTGERKELPARVILVPPGRERVRAFFVSFGEAIKVESFNAGRATGRAFAEGLINGSTDSLKSKFSTNVMRALMAVMDPIGATGRFIGEFIGGEFIRGFLTDFVPLMARAIIDGLTQAVTDAIPSFTSLGGRIRESIFRGFARRGPVSLKNIITDQVKEAIQGARQTLQGAAGTLGGLVGEIIGGSSPEAKRLREIRAQQQREAREREDARLREAVANAQTADERAIAERDLQDFILEQEAIRLEESIAQNQDAANRNIANLVEEFNRGLISADVFSARLNEIIGADRGAELGIAFAGAFDRELQTILATARDIFSVIGTGETIAGATGAGVSTALSAENQRRFDEALADWQKRRDSLNERLQRALDSAKDEDSPGGKAITDAEKKGISSIRDLIEKHKTRKPNRGAYGLALGGILKQPTFVAGEAGKEAVIPLESSSAMDILRQAVGGGGGGNQVINLTVNAGLGTNPDELSRVIVDSIKYYERRNGQVFTGPLVQSVATSSGSLIAAASSGPSDTNRITQRRRG